MSSELGWRADLSYDSPEAVAVREDLRGSGLSGLAELTVDPRTEGFEKLGTLGLRSFCIHETIHIVTGRLIYS
jgi:hypothetical protein